MAAPLSGEADGYQWTVQLVPEGERVCMVVEVTPSILKPPEQGAEAIGDFLDSTLWEPPPCTAPLSTEGLRFDPLFGPFVYQGDQYRQFFVAGLVAEGVGHVDAVTEQGDVTSVKVLGQGVFVYFPAEPVVELRFTTGEKGYSCPVETLASGLGSSVPYCDSDD